MFHNIYSVKSMKRQQGSMLVIALFVIIVLGFLAYAMIQITDNSNRATVFEVYGARALNAANSGAERALNETLGPGNSACPSAPSNELPSINGFVGCELKITCEQFNITETGFTHFRIESTASCTAGEFTTQRSVAVEARIAI